MPKSDETVTIFVTVYFIIFVRKERTNDAVLLIGASDQKILLCPAGFNNWLLDLVICYQRCFVLNPGQMSKMINKDLD